MTNQEILERAIQKALDSGWTYYVNKFDIAAEYGAVLEDHRFNQWYTLFVDHNFAKALWGERLRKIDGSLLGSYKDWQFHLQQMVVATDPVAYLGENL